MSDETRALLAEVREAVLTAVSLGGIAFLLIVLMV